MSSVNFSPPTPDPPPSRPRKNPVEDLEEVQKRLNDPDESVRADIIDRVHEYVMICTSSANRVQDDDAARHMDLWAHILRWRTAKSVVAAIQDSSATVRAKALNALPVLVGYDVTTLTRVALKDPDPEVRVTAVRLLGRFKQVRDDWVAQERPVPPNVRRVPVEILMAEPPPGVRESLVRALSRFGWFGQENATLVVRTLIKTIKDKHAGVRRAGIEAVRCCTDDLDLASEALSALVTALRDQDAAVRREAAVTLAWLGPEAARKAPHLVVVLLQDADEQVREQAARALLRIVPEDDLFDRLRGVGDSQPRKEVVRILRGIGQAARPLRQKLEATWDEEEEGSAGDQREECPTPEEAQLPDEGQESAVSDKPEENPFPEGAAAPRFEYWAVGRESDKKWHLFRMVRGEWQHRGPLKGLRGGLRAKLLDGFAESEGVLPKLRALEIAGGPLGPRRREEVMRMISPELTKLRKILLRAVRLLQSEADPLPWNGPGEVWRAAMSIGYAVQEDGQKLGGEGRLKFKLRGELSPDEKIDAGL
jgi:HEAT repeat protein